MEAHLTRPHAVSIQSMSKEALGQSLNKAWDEIERLRDQISALRAERDMVQHEALMAAGKS